MTDAPVTLAVVGHTNAGKTSLLRTLTRRSDFGEVSSRPGTTRHVESVDLKADGATAVRLFDTPGLEDATALLDHLKALPGQTPVDRVHAFLAGPEARGVFEQEAKVLRRLLDVDAALYVIDCREPVLPKYRSEIEILASCARPVMPVLNFVRDAGSREAQWQSTLRSYGLHAQVRFDAVAPFAGSEAHLYEDLGTLLHGRRTQLKAVVAWLERERTSRRVASARRIAELLVESASMRASITQEVFDDPAQRATSVAGFRADALKQARACVDDLLAIHSFRRDEADDAVLPFLDGRWEDDLFGPGALHRVGKQVGAGAAMGASIGMAADIAFGGLSLGAATAVGAAIGGIASQGFGPIGRKLINKARGLVGLTLEDELLLALASQMVQLAAALEQRGHAASAVATRARAQLSAPVPEEATARIAAAVEAVQPARRHVGWGSASWMIPSAEIWREQVVDASSLALEDAVRLLAR